MINLFFIKTFVSVAQLGSFRLAALKNNITQPAVSQHIRSIEKNLHCVLIDRSSKKVQLTSEGQIFLSYAIKLLKLYETARSKVMQKDKRHTGVVHITSIYTLGLYQLKPIMQHMLKKYPNINIHLEFVHHDAIYEIIKNKFADFGLVAFPKKTPGCEFKIFAEEELVLVQSHKDTLFKRKNIQLQDLNGIKFVGLDSKTPTGNAIYHFLTSQGVTLNIVKEDSNIEIIKNAVEIGIGCSILPKSTVIKEIKNKIFDIIHVENFEIKRPLAIVHNKKKIWGESARLFYEMISNKNSY